MEEFIASMDEIQESRCKHLNLHVLWFSGGVGKRSLTAVEFP